MRLIANLIILITCSGISEDFHPEASFWHGPIPSRLEIQQHLIEFSEDGKVNVSQVNTHLANTTTNYYLTDKDNNQFAYVNDLGVFDLDNNLLFNTNVTGRNRDGYFGPSELFHVRHFPAPGKPCFYYIVFTELPPIDFDPRRSFFAIVNISENTKVE